MSSNLKILVWLPGSAYIINLINLILLQGDRSYNMILGGINSVGLIGAYFCLYLIHRFNISGRGVGSKVGLVVPALGITSYILHYLLLLLFSQDVRVLMPLGAVLTGIGMVIVGFQTLISDVWCDWKKFTPLIVGLYPFLVMFPALFITGQPNVYLIMLWGIPWLLFGMALNKMLALNKAV